MDPVWTFSADPENARQGRVKRGCAVARNGRGRHGMAEGAQAALTCIRRCRCSALAGKPGSRCGSRSDPGLRECIDSDECQAPFPPAAAHGLLLC